MTQTMVLLVLTVAAIAFAIRLDRVAGPTRAMMVRRRRRRETLRSALPPAGVQRDDTALD